MDPPAAKPRNPKVNWEPYHDEVIDYYVTKDHTIQETIDHLLSKHQLLVT